MLGVIYLFNIFSKEGLALFLFTLPALLLSLSIHEFAHAYTAYKLGDMSQKYRGRLTLDPFKHIDIVGFLCIMLCGFGWGKPVQINPRNFDGKYSLSKAEAMVAVAGPVMNFIIAFIFLIIYGVYGLTVTTITHTTRIISSIIVSIISVNLGLGVSSPSFVATQACANSWNVIATITPGKA